MLKLGGLFPVVLLGGGQKDVCLVCLYLQEETTISASSSCLPAGPGGGVDGWRLTGGVPVQPAGLCWEKQLHPTRFLAEGTFCLLLKRSWVPLTDAGGGWNRFGTPPPCGASGGLGPDPINVASAFTDLLTVVQHCL